jgi:hypothetical protein
MACRIERLIRGEDIVLQISGRIQAEHIETIRDLIQGEPRPAALDLAEVTLADRDTVTFLAWCARRGIRLMNCSEFLVEWIQAEQSR